MVRQTVYIFSSQPVILFQSHNGFNLTVVFEKIVSWFRLGLYTDDLSDIPYFQLMNATYGVKIDHGMVEDLVLTSVIQQGVHKQELDLSFKTGDRLNITLANNQLVMTKNKIQIYQDRLAQKVVAITKTFIQSERGSHFFITY